MLRTRSRAFRPAIMANQPESQILSTPPIFVSFHFQWLRTRENIETYSLARISFEESKSWNLQFECAWQFLRSAVRSLSLGFEGATSPTCASVKMASIS
jgi:hypothetical protein